MEAQTYEHVYCGEEEGQLRVSTIGIMFDPYFPQNIPQNKWLPNHIGFHDILTKEYRISTIEASYSEYSTTVTMYEYRLTVHPSKEIIFQMKDPAEWERLQHDLDAFGQGAPRVAVPIDVYLAGFSAEENFEDSSTGDASDDSFGDADIETAQADPVSDTTVAAAAAEAAAAADVEPSDETTNRESAQEEPAWQDEEETEEDEEGRWSAADAWNAKDTTFYPVQHRQEVGRLDLSGTSLKFVPDRHVCPVQSLPWASLAGKPFFSPFNYPQPVMHIRYHTTRVGPKSAGFVMADHDELRRLEKDITTRIRPFANVPRERVNVPAPSPTPRSASHPPQAFPATPMSGPGFGPEPVKRPRTPEGVCKTAVGDNAAAAAAAATDPSCSYTFDSERSSMEFTGYSGDSHHSSIDPLVVKSRMPRRYLHKEETPRRLLLLFVSYCCVVTMFGLTLSVIFGYFFGPKEPRSVYVRTKPPGSIYDYLGNKPAETSQPTNDPTWLRDDSYSVGSQIFQRESIAPENEAVGLLPENSTELPTDTGRGSNAGLGVSGTSMEATHVPTIQATRSEKSILDVLMSESSDGGEAIRTMGTPQHAAYLLLELSGELDQAPSDSVIKQKYALATLYYSTDGDQWKDGESSWKKVKKNDCEKPHLVCDEQSEHLIGIKIPGNSLKGKIPPEIGMLDKITKLDFSDNGLIGPIPSELGLLSELESLDLSNNPGLTGNIPSEVMNLSKMSTLTTELPMS